MSTLAEWGTEIEQLDGSTIVTVEVETEPVENLLRIPAQFAGRPIVAAFLQEPKNVLQLTRAHALTLNWSGAGQVFHFILLNMARAADWEGRRDALLAHEYGHIWLQATGYWSPEYDNSCLAIHSGDIVQHVLIREETRRRGFDYMEFWKQPQEAWLAAQQGPVELDRCQRMQLASAYLDARLGLTNAQWEKRGQYLGAIWRDYAPIATVGEELANFMEGLDLWDRSLYQTAMERSARSLQAL